MKYHENVRIESVIPETGEVVEFDGGVPSLSGQFTRVGWQALPGMSFDEWALVGETLKSIEQSVMWWVGDWLNHGESAYGETYAQAVDATDYSYQTLVNSRNVCRKFESNRRRLNLTFSHHAEVAALPQLEQDAWLDLAEQNNWSRNELRKQLGSHNHRALGTGENEWYTPAKYIEMAREVLGNIDLDPATSEAAQEDIAARSYYTIDDDGLSRDWCGRVWLNPPYAQPHIENFARKLVEEVEAGRTSAAICLTHNYTDTAWFHALANSATAICFTRGRIGFESPSGEIAAPTQGQAFFYFGEHDKLFREVFSPIGFVVDV